MPETVSRKKRAQAQIELENAGAPDPFAWLVERWKQKATSRKIKPGSNSVAALEAEELGLKLLPFLRPRLKAVDVTLAQDVFVDVVIGGDE